MAAPMVATMVVVMVVELAVLLGETKVETMGARSVGRTACETVEWMVRPKAVTTELRQAAKLAASSVASSVE